MKTIQEILKYESGTTCKLIDQRDILRLCEFVPADDLKKLGFLEEGKHIPESLTEENIIKHLKSDLAFAIEKAVNQRGISAALMFDVINMWLWILDDPLANSMRYNNYGLSFFNKVKEKYGT